MTPTNTLNKFIHSLQNKNIDGGRSIEALLPQSFFNDSKDKRQAVLFCIQQSIKYMGCTLLYKDNINDNQENFYLSLSGKMHRIILNKEDNTWKVNPRSFSFVK